MSNVVTPAEFQQADAEEILTVSQKVSKFAESFSLADAPKEITHLAKLHVLDSIGIGLASSTKDYGHKAASAGLDLGGEGDFPIIGLAHRLPVRDAIMVNGVLIHGLDFDDTHTTGVIHISASTVPTALMLAMANAKSGYEALEAYLVGVETGTRVAKATAGGIHANGFHTTGIVGAYGCAMVAGKLSDLTVDQYTNAQGLVVSFGGPTRAYHANGAWAKRMHTGIAAVNGVNAAMWARHGFTGPDTVYEYDQGLYGCYAHGQEVDLDVVTAGYGEEWEMTNVAYKPYPACHWLHAFIESGIRLREEHGLTPDQIESIIVLAHPNQGAVCAPEEAKRRPQSSYQAQFSVHFATAAAICRGKFTLAEIEPETYSDPAVLELCDKIHYETTTETLYPDYFSGTVIVRTKDGRELKHAQKHNLGTDEHPITEEQVQDKFMSNATRAVSTARAEEIRSLILGIEDQPDLDEFDAAISLS
ncbi:MAG: 2-methylcitrate dehydratase [Rhodospirillaceae bacterium]|nr:2-methylcitrate dehydratase [Rhodospirillaceae bacterium]